MPLTVTLTPYTLAPNALVTPPEINLVGQPTLEVSGVLKDLDNVATTAPAHGQPLVYDSATSKWGPGEISSDYAGGVVAGLTKDFNAWTDDTLLYKLNAKMDAAVLQEATAGAWVSPVRCKTIYPASTLVLDVTASGAGGRDTGALATGWWYVWLIHNGTDTNLLASTAYTIASLVLPSGYTWAALLTVVYVANSGTGALRAMQQVGNEVYQDDVTVFTGKSGTTLYAAGAGLVLSGADLTNFRSGVPAIARACRGLVGVDSGSADCQILVGAATRAAGIPANKYALQRFSFQSAAALFGAFYGVAPFQAPCNQTFGTQNIYVTAATGATTYRLHITGFTL